MANLFRAGAFSGSKDNNDKPPFVGGGGGGVTNTFTNLGTGAAIFAALVGADVQFRTITVGPNLAVNQTADNVNITFTGTLGEVNTMSNLGTTGARVFSAKTGVNFALRRIVAAAGSGITVTENTNDISIGTNLSTLATLLAPLLPPLISLGETNTASNRGAGEGVFAAKVGVDLQFKSLVAGSNITLSSDDDTITINSTGGGGGGGGVGAGGDEKAARFTNIQNQILTSGAFTILDYDDVVTNNSPTTYTNNGAGRVTVTETGFYTLTAGVAVQASLLSAVNTTGLGIFRNGEAIAAETNSQTLAVGETRVHTCSTSIQLTAGDIIDARAYVLSALGVGNILALLLPLLFGQNATQINHLSLVKQETGDAMDGQNLGSGEGEVFRQVTANNFQFRTLRAGANTTITQDANEITISSTGGGGGGGDAPIVSPDANRKWFFFDDLVGFDNGGTASQFFVITQSGTGASGTNVNNHTYNLRGLTGHAYVESGTASTAFAQIVSNTDATQNTVSPGAKVYAQTRFYIQQIPNNNALLALTLYGETATGISAGTAGIQLATNLVGAGNWQILVATTAAGDPLQTFDTGIPVDLSQAIQEIEMLYDDITNTVTVVINGVSYTTPTTYTLSQIQSLITSNLSPHNPFRFGVYNNNNANTTEARVVIDSVGFGLDLTQATDTGARRPITLF